MKPVFAKKAARPDPELLTLKAELLEAQGDLAQAYRQFDQALDPELVESCVYQILSLIHISSPSAWPLWRIGRIRPGCCSTWAAP